MNVRGSESARQGFTTDDGWRVSLDRFMTALGDVSLHLDTCTDYAITRYDRLYDFAVADGGKVGLVHGLGDCNIEFRLRAPSSDSLLEGGVTEDDRALMRIEASDAYADERRVGLVVRGRAQRDGVNKEFLWFFRRSFTIKRCYAGGNSVSEINIAGGDMHERHLVVRPEELFRTLPIASAPTDFSRFAAADANDDGLVTIEELSAVEVPFDDVLEAYRDTLPSEVVDTIDGGGLVDESLATLVYGFLVPRVVAFEGAEDCTFEIRRPFF